MLYMTPYLHFMGNAEEAMNFYCSVFNGTFTIYARYKEVPGSEKMSAADQEKFIHISLQIAENTTIMATDMLESMERELQSGNNFHICVHTESEAEADRFFQELIAGGQVEMPMNKTFFGAYFGMLTDRFGIRWMINYTYTQQ